MWFRVEVHASLEGTAGEGCLDLDEIFVLGRLVGPVELDLRRVETDLSRRGVVRGRHHQHDAGRSLIRLDVAGAIFEIAQRLWVHDAVVLFRNLLRDSRVVDRCFSRGTQGVTFRRGSSITGWRLEYYT